MSVIEMVLVFVCIPAGFFTLVACLVFLPGMSRRPRYRPGESWSFEPVWYGPHPRALPDDLSELLPESVSGRPAVAGSPRLAITGPSTEGRPAPAAILDRNARGGAHGDW